MMSTLQQLVGIISGTIDQKVDSAVQRQPPSSSRHGEFDAIKHEVTEQMDHLLRNIAGSVDQVVRKVCAAEVEACIRREVCAPPNMFALFLLNVFFLYLPHRPRE